MTEQEQNSGNDTAEGADTQPGVEATGVAVAYATETQRIGADGQPLEPPPGHGGRPQEG
jgi:hypothetical protein